MAGGTVRIGTTSDLTPALVFSGTKASEQTLTGLVYDTLVSYPADSLDPQPRLAENWEVSPDGLTLTLELRKNVTFHDGRPFTSKDVEFSLQTYSDPAYAGQLARVAQLITKYDTSDPHRIVLELEDRANNIFDLFSIVPIIDKNSFDQWVNGEEYIGTGAFEFVVWYPGSRIEFEANKEYWDGAPAVNGAELLVIPDQQTQFSQLRSGQLDLLADALPRDIKAVEDSPTFNVVTTQGTGSMVYAGANVTAPGLEDPRVRQAISLAVDRDRIVKEVYQDRARATSLPWPEYSPAYEPSADAPQRDVALAKKLIDQVGSIPTITISYGSNSLEHQDIAQIISANLAELGIETKLEPVEYTTMISQLRNGSFPGLWVLGHGFAQYNPATLVTSAFPFNSIKNSSNFSHDAYAADVQRSWRTTDPNSTSALDAYKDLNKHLLEQSFVIELASPDSEFITSGNLHGIGWSKRGELDLSDVYFTQ
ncbi:ABC transporter substrate-binding protein [Corynebacterium crudilactis]|uniref:ABC transporter substrate-binding protein n=1 Tax=Corynebacterium crudilactis TaxID=1652495 RepID=UPI001FDF9CE4|nr:ABC transporter substrate-binding protein [Corynebacterium crudilactis]